ncbi:MAG: deoxyribodipyrimidine photolyase [bacterium]
MTQRFPSAVPAVRIRASNPQPVNPQGRYVLFWMIGARRTRYSFALERAVQHAVELNAPLVILEPLRVDDPFASARLHRFLLDGMADTAQRLASRRVLYHPYVEPEPGAGRGLVQALAQQAAVVVTDWFPSFMIPRLVAAAAAQLPVRLEEVDSNGLLPLAATDRVFRRAVDFRRHLQRTLLDAIPQLPQPDPLVRKPLPVLDSLPAAILRRWPAADPKLLRSDPGLLSRLPIDHRIAPAPPRGGSVAAEQALERFVSKRLPRYAEQRNQPQVEATSGLSPYLHFGHISSHELFVQLTQRERWTPERLGTRATGARAGFWGLSEPAEAWLDQLVTWRELGFNACHTMPNVDRYDSLPDWAQQTLARHAPDPRPHGYGREQLEAAQTHDPLWNAAQRQLLRDGTIHGYLRMLWGKKILEWSPDPRTALAVMLELNDRYALDGRDPNSLSGIFWVLGRYDRAWGPERPIFGKVRYMSSANTARKVRVQDYLRRYAA